MKNHLEAISSLLTDVGRTHKPRTHGITIALDTGLGLHGVEDLCTVSGAHLDYAKIAWGSSMITGGLAQKVELYRKHNVEPMFGGTFFEYAYLHGKAEEYLALIRETKIHMEVSDGTLDIPLSEKLQWIEKFAAVTEVFSEIGGKTQPQNRDWASIMKREFDAGAKKLVVEGREVGPVGQPIREDVVDDVVEFAGGFENLVFESLERPQQLFFLKKFGPNVNLANIKTTDVLTLESFRLGLKEHTLRSTWEAHVKRS